MSETNEVLSDVDSQADIEFEGTAEMPETPGTPGTPSTIIGTTLASI